MVEGEYALKLFPLYMGKNNMLLLLQNYK